jgi:hypothetical protein
VRSEQLHLGESHTYGYIDHGPPLAKLAARALAVRVTVQREAEQGKEARQVRQQQVGQPAAGRSALAEAAVRVRPGPLGN